MWKYSYKLLLFVLHGVSAIRKSILSCPFRTVKLWRFTPSIEHLVLPTLGARMADWMSYLFIPAKRFTPGLYVKTEWTLLPLENFYCHEVNMSELEIYSSWKGFLIWSAEKI